MHKHTIWLKQYIILKSRYLLNRCVKKLQYAQYILIVQIVFHTVMLITYFTGVMPTPPITESQVAVTSHWNAREPSGHNKRLLNNRLDRNNSWSSFISSLWLYTYRIYWEVNICIVCVWNYFRTPYKKNYYKRINTSEIGKMCTVLQPFPILFPSALLFAISVTLL